MPQDDPDYTDAEADRLTRESEKWLAQQRLKCTCRNSDFGMDVEFCPVHNDQMPIPYKSSKPSVEPSYDGWVNR